MTPTFLAPAPHLTSSLAALFVPTSHVALAIVGVVVGFLVGLTGAGGGALLTPILILFFGVPSMAAVGSDLVASLVMKPVGGLVHFRRNTVRFDVVGWLSLGSIPGALGGVGLLEWAGHGKEPALLQPIIGGALVLTVLTTALRPRLAQRASARKGGNGSATDAVRPLATFLLGLAGGVLVGFTSVGSGSVMVAGLLVLYPTLSIPALIGTDLVQAIPLVGAAALGHLMAGNVHFGVSLPVMAGAVPAVYLGARLSATGTNARPVRLILVGVLLATGVRLLMA